MKFISCLKWKTAEINSDGWLIGYWVLMAHGPGFVKEHQAYGVDN